MTDIKAVLVDDDAEWGETTARLLNHRRENFEVEFTDSLEEATEMIKRNGEKGTVDCIIADYHMPGLDGIDLLETVRDEYPDFPFILITARGSEEVASEAISKQVTDYITKKPGEDQTETIANRVENAVRSYRAERRVKELNRKIEQLHQNASRIGECETREEVYNEVADAGVRVVGFDEALALERTDSGFLLRAKRGDGGTVAEGEVLENTGGAVEGRAYSSGRSVVTGTSESASVATEEKAGEAMAVPLGEYGVLVAVSEGFDGNDIELTETLAEHATSALNRLESRERILEERDGKETMRNLLTNSSSRGEIEESVAEYLVTEEGYSLAWVGEASDGVFPRAFVREKDKEEGYLESILYPGGDKRGKTESKGNYPAVRAVSEGEIKVAEELDGKEEGWAIEAAENGYRSAAAVPLEYDDILYGVLAVYSEKPDAFGDYETNRLEDFAESLSSAIKSTRIREGLTSDRPMRLEMEVTEHPLNPVSREWGTEVLVNSAIERQEDVLYQVNLRDVPVGLFSEEGSDRNDQRPDIEIPGGAETIELIEEGNDGARARISVQDSAPELRLADYGGMVEKTVIEDTATVTARLPSSVDLSEVADAVNQDFSGARITAKTSSGSTTDGEPLSEDLRIWQLLNEELTQKQFDALRTAYRNGYFERPRKTNATETAEIMGVSRPTFVQHLRVAEKKILDHMIETR